MKGRALSHDVDAAGPTGSLAFLAGGGAATRLILARDWSTHPLGPPEHWPDILKVSLSTILNSPESMILAWGAEDLTFFFNETYFPLLGPRLDWAMGAPFTEVWADAWQQAKPIIDDAFAGRSTRFVDLPWKLATDRGAADTWWTFSYSRVLGPDGEIAGLFILTNETTGKVLGDRKRAEVEEQLHRAQQAGGMGLFAVTPDGLVRPTPSFCELYGIPVGETMPSTLFEDLVVAEDRAKVSDLASRAAGIAPLDVEYRIRRADTGELRWIARRGEIERDTEGRFLRFVGIARDITVEMATRRALEDNQRFQSALLKLGDVTRDVADPAEISYEAAKLLGLTLGVELVGYGEVDAQSEILTVERDWTTPGTPSLAGTVRFRDFGSYIEDLKSGITVVVEDARTDPRTRSSAEALIERSAGAFVNMPLFEHGRFVALQFVSQLAPRIWTEAERDFIREVAARVRVSTERARLETERQDRVNELAALNASLEEEIARRTADRNRLWQLSTDLMLIAGFDGAIQAVNPAWERILGWTGADLIGTPLFDLIHPDDLQHTIAGAQAISLGESYARFENRYRHRDGSYRDIVWTAGPGEGFIVAVGRDSTEDKAKAAALVAAEEQLRQAQKMEAVGQLTGGIAHDFNNMLTGVIGSLDLLKRYIPEGRQDRIDRYIDAASTSAQRAAGLTQRLLAFSRRQSLDVRPVDVNQLVVGMEELLRRTLGENIGLEVQLHAGAWSARTDQNQLESALLNLTINARDAMPDGGRLTIETANTTLDPSFTATVRDLDPGDYIVICVSDTGTGMTPEVIEKAFDPFFTTKPIGSGTGLGLSMIYGFAKQSGGHALIYSEVGQGTTVKLYLPRSAEPVMTNGPEDRASIPAMPGEQVLLVEDDPAVRMLVTDVLAELGYGVEQAGDAREAIPLLMAMPRIDLLITDVGLPGMNGRQLAEVAREHRPDLKILFVTGYAERAAVRGEFLADGMDMITKPFAIDALSKKIRAMIESL